MPHPDRKGHIVRVAYTPSGQLFAAGYPTGIIQLWDPSSGKELRRINTPPGYRGSAEYALTPQDYSDLYIPIEGRKVVRESGILPTYRIEFQGKVLVWDLTTGKEKTTLKPLPGHGVISADLSPDGKRLITVERPGYSGTATTQPPEVVRLIDTSTGRGQKVATGYCQAAFPRKGSTFYLAELTTFGNSSARVYALDVSGKTLATLAQSKNEQFTWPVLSTDDRWLAVIQGKRMINDPATVKVFDLTNNKEVASFPSSGKAPFFAPFFSPDSRLVATGDYDGWLYLFDVQNKKTLLKRKFGKSFVGRWMAFSPDGRLAISVTPRSEGERARDPDPLDQPQSRVLLFDLKNLDKPEEMVCPHGTAGGIAFSPDGKTLAVGGIGALHLFDVSSLSGK